MFKFKKFFLISKYLLISITIVIIFYESKNDHRIIINYYVNLKNFKNQN